MKKKLAFLVILLALGTTVFAQSVVYQQSFSGYIMLPESHGEWDVRGARLYQLDVEEPLAKINMMAAQSGEMQYEFTVRYEGGGIEDLMGGFGIHVFMDDPWDGKSWGNGDSYLLWLNYDMEPEYGPKGLTAQIYKSTSEIEMALIGYFDLNDYAYLLSASNMNVDVPVRLKIDGNRGSVWVESPMQPGYGFRFSIGQPLGRGGYAALRTNSLALSFDDIKISKLN